MSAVVLVFAALALILHIANKLVIQRQERAATKRRLAVIQARYNW
jgi:hypothetical protein